MFFKKKKKTTLLEDIQTSSKWVSEALISSGYHADYSMESLKELDRFLKEENKPGGILSKGVGQKLFALGSYVGEVFIKQYGGHWETDDNDRQGEIKITVVLDNEITFYPVISVMKCYDNCEENSLYALSQAIEQSCQE
ncbi:MAG: hypothetical protein ACLUVC_13245 [Longibaculum sp.]